MNRSLETFTKLYKPYKISKINEVYVFKTMNGDYAIKCNPKIDYKKLYNYLYSRGFSYVPELSLDSRDDTAVFNYEDDIIVDSHQKGLDLIRLVALLHLKTSYFKNITSDKYKEIYDNILNNLVYVDNLYNEYFEIFLEEEFIVPSHYLFLRNYSLIYNAIQYCLKELDDWYSVVKDKNKERVALVHNNLKLEHMIKNSNEYLISWDNYTFDTPVLDLYHFYLNEWMNVDFEAIFQEYSESFSLLDEEKKLLNILISIPYKIEFDDNEYLNCRKMREFINYLNNSWHFVDS